MSRRSLVKLGMVVGAAGAATAVGITTLAPLLNPPPTGFNIEHRLVYTKFPTSQWWNPLSGQPVKVTDFEEWAGATAVWRGEFTDGVYKAGTGFPVLVIRVKRDDAVFTAPPASDYTLPPGFNLYYDDPARDIRIVVVYDRCAHLCCYPGWQVVTDPPPARDYVAPAPNLRNLRHRSNLLRVPRVPI